MSETRLSKIKLIAAAVGALLAVIIILQNLEPASTHILFMELTMPRAVLLAVTFALGLVTGLVVAGVVGRGKDRAKS